IEIVVQPPARPTPKPVAGVGAPVASLDGVAQDAAPCGTAAAQLGGMITARAEAATAAQVRANATQLSTPPSAGSSISAPLDPRFTFDNFVVGKPNELAYAAARRVADAPTPPFNPLFLYGGVGLGKTHLMHAIGLHIKKQTPERRIIYLSAEKFMYQFVRALRTKDTMAFKEQFRSVDVLMIDDVQFIGGRE